ncbi:ABC transporter permease [Rhodococcoides kyotonense]|uniref:Transport permease protein n=1 Tax=Rhodococcoides kyotonense TaxID=398843 RepID=A0A239LBQ7_9NOCA|nr:ABC transporter permease [Rhodococcus kyotonensis]SNT27273.1 ABC-2 type transport system permease protein [Rhodococcus kyotonensis]
MSENATSVLVPQTLLQSKRLLLHLVRDPMTLMQSILYPAIMLVILTIVLGQQVSAFSGHSSLYGTVPMTALLSAMLGSVAGAVRLGREWDAGILARFWVLPIHRASSLAGRVTAEAARILVTTTVIVVVGLLLGFHCHGSWALLFAIPLVYGMAFATAVMAASFSLGKTALVETVSLFCSLSMFLSPGFVPLAAYPTWIQPLVEYQPMSCAIEAMQAVALGEPSGAALARAGLWSLGIFAVAVVPAYRGLRRATQPR